jgi:hypothetical protein
LRDADPADGDTLSELHVVSRLGDGSSRRLARDLFKSILFFVVPAFERFRGDNGNEDST